MRPKTAMLLTLLLCLLVYAAGLSGPFLFDDLPNFSVISAWLAGRGSVGDAIWGTGSGLLHRPLSMLTFSLDAAIAGLRPGHMKLVNLVLHCGIGVVVYQLLTLLFHRRDWQGLQAAWVGALGAALWLLHPLQLSTVLYVVQRMAQLGALFVLLGLWLYVRTRQRMSEGTMEPAQLLQAALLWGLFFLLGIFSKENAAILPLLCLAFEGVFRAQLERQHRGVLWFNALVGVVPILLGVTLLLVMPDRFLAGYESRHFDLWQRLWTQSAVLVDYLQQILWPQTARMGLYFDDFPLINNGLAGAWPYITILLAISVFAWWMRRREPVVLFGWLFFLIAHSVESSLLPLELYFEHRNYLPMVGIVLMVLGTAVWGLRRASAEGHSAPGWLAPLAVVVVLLLAGLTGQKALTWRSLDAIAAEGYAQHPNSLRASLDALNSALTQNRLSDAASIMQGLADSANPNNRVVGALGRVSVACIDGGKASDELQQQAMDRLSDRITLGSYQAFSMLARISSDKQCQGADAKFVVAIIERALSKAESQPDRAEPKWRLRHSLSLLLARQGRVEEAIAQSQLAWNQRSADTAVGSVLVQLHLAAGNREAANQVLQEIEARRRWSDSLTKDEVRRLREMVSHSQTNSG